MEKWGTPENMGVQRDPQCHGQLSIGKHFACTRISWYVLFFQRLHFPRGTGASPLPPRTLPCWLCTEHFFWRSCKCGNLVRLVKANSFKVNECMPSFFFFFSFFLAVFTEHKSACRNGSHVSNSVWNFYSQLAQSSCEWWKLFPILCPVHWKCALAGWRSWTWSNLHCVAIFGR